MPHKRLTIKIEPLRLGLDRRLVEGQRTGVGVTDSPFPCTHKFIELRVEVNK